MSTRPKKKNNKQPATRAGRTRATRRPRATASTNKKAAAFVAIPIYEHRGLGRKAGVKRVRVLARRGVWILHWSMADCRGWTYTVTHTPTGFAALKGLKRDKAISALRACAAIPGDWSFTDERCMSSAQRSAGARVKAKYEATTRPHGEASR